MKSKKKALPKPLVGTASEVNFTAYASKNSLQPLNLEKKPCLPSSLRSRLKWKIGMLGSECCQLLLKWWRSVFSRKMKKSWKNKMTSLGIWFLDAKKPKALSIFPWFKSATEWGWDQSNFSPLSIELATLIRWELSWSSLFMCGSLREKGDLLKKTQLSSLLLIRLRDSIVGMNCRKFSSKSTRFKRHLW